MVMLYRKMLRDVWKQKSSFLSIFLLMFMGCYIFSGITTEYHGMQTYSDSYHAESNMADALLQGTHLSKLQDSNLDTQEVMKLSSTLQGHEDISLEVNIIKENRISKMKVMDGVNFDPSLDGVWLDERFAQAHGYRVGDSLTFLIQGQSIQKEIKGLVLSVEYIYQVKDNAMTPDHEKSGFLYMNQTNLPFSFQANQLLVKSTLSDQELKNKLIQETNGKNCLITLQHDNLNYSMLQDEIDQHKELGLIFSFTFLGIAVFVSITTIHRLLHQQQLQIGILKALGFSKHTLFFHYATHCTFVTLLGSILGCITGAWSFPVLVYPFMNELYALPELRGSIIPLTYLLPLFTTMICIFISLIITRNYLHYPTAQVLSGNIKRRIIKIQLPQLFTHTSFITQWNLKDVTRNPLRSFMSIFGVLGCTALLMSAFGIYTTMTHLTDWTYHTLETYDCKVNGPFDEETLQTLTHEMDADEIMNASIDIQTSTGQDQLLLTVLSDTRYLHPAESEHSFVDLTYGAGVSKNIADQYHLKEGDILTWKPSNTTAWQQVEIESILRTPYTQGITLMKSLYEQTGLEYTPTSLIGKTIDKDNFDLSSISSIQYHDDIVQNMDTMMEATIMMLSIFMIAATVLGSVILYNLGSLSYMERYYELATLKVLGFQSHALRKIMIQQNLWLTFIGILLGLPSGWLLLSFMLKTVQATLDVIIYLPWSVVLLSCGGTLSLSFLIIWCVSKKVKDIDMVSALKSND